MKLPDVLHIGLLFFGSGCGLKLKTERLCVFLNTFLTTNCYELMTLVILMLSKMTIFSRLIKYFVHAHSHWL